MTATKTVAQSLSALLKQQGVRINLRTTDVATINRYIDFFQAVSKNLKCTPADRLGAEFKQAYLQDRLAMISSLPSENLLAQTLREEIVIRWAQTRANGTITVDRDTAILLLEQCSFINENGWLRFSLRPLDREQCIIAYIVDFDKMPNGFIYFINNKYDLSIPMHAKEDEPVDDIDRVDDGAEMLRYSARFIKHGANLRY